MNISVSVRDGASRKIRRLLGRITPTMVTVVTATATSVWRDAAKSAPIDTGHLRRSIGPPAVVTTWGSVRATVGARAVYAAHVEFGTRAHVIRPRRAKLLRFFSRSGGVVFAKRVRHPGTRPRPYLLPALRRHESKMRVALRAAIIHTWRTT